MRSFASATRSPRPGTCPRRGCRCESSLYQPLMKKLIGFLLLMLVGMPARSASRPALVALLRQFVHDAMAEQLSNTALADTYFCTAILHRDDQYGLKARAAMEWALTLQRQKLREEHLPLAELSFVPYDELPAAKLPPKPFHMLGPTTNVYVARYRGQILLYFLLDNTKIASTLLVGQGDEHYFMDFCH